MPDSQSRLRPYDSARDKSTPRLTRLYRLTRLLIHLVYGCFTVGVLFPFFSSKRRLAAIKRWSRQLLRMLRVRVSVHGSLPSGHAPTLIVSNHVSWLDIWVVNSVVPVRFVAKSDIRRWPVVGFLVSGAGTIFIERQKRQDTMRTNRAIVQALTRGEHVAMFPEGTMTDGTELKPFHASLFQPAVGAGARVAVMALRYVHADGSLDLGASYAGERSLWESIGLILAHRRLRAEVIFAATVDVRGKTRRDIACETEAVIADALALERPGRRTGTVDDPRGAGPTASAPTGSLYPAQSPPARGPDPRLTSVQR
jgi:1-acyl-sn-glycerol-3-phosphate acyltransferase